MLESTGSGDADRICALLLSLGEALSRAGRSSEAKEVLRRAATLAERTGRTDRLARAAVEYGGRFAWSRASTDQFLVPLLERALAAIDEADTAERVKLLARLATATRDDPSRARRVRIAEEAVQIARRLDDPETLAFALEGHWTASRRPRHRGRRDRTGRDAGQTGRADGRQGACARRAPIPAERFLDAREPSRCRRRTGRDRVTRGRAGPAGPAVGPRHGSDDARTHGGATRGRRTADL